MLEKSLKIKISENMRYSDMYDTANAICAYLGIGDCIVGAGDEWAQNFKYKNRKDFHAQYAKFKEAKLLANLEEIEFLCQEVFKEELVVVKDLLDDVEKEIGKIYSFPSLFKELCVQVQGMENYHLLSVNFEESTEKSKIDELILIRNQCIEEYKNIYNDLKSISGKNGLCCFEEGAKNISKIKLVNILKLLKANKNIVCFENRNENWYLFEEKNNCILNTIGKIGILRSNIEIELLVQSIQRVIDERRRNVNKPTYEIIVKFLRNTNCIEINDDYNSANIKICGKRLSNIELALLQIYSERDEYTYREITKLLSHNYKPSTIQKVVYRSPILCAIKHQNKDATYKLVTHTMINEKQIINEIIDGDKKQDLDKVECNYYYEPVNLKQWNMFEKVSNIGHIEPFLATKTMKIGDKLLLNVGLQDKNFETGVYAIAEIITEPYILESSPEDYCNNKLTINAQITEIDYLNPIINKEECKRIFKQFRTVHKISQEAVLLLKEFIHEKNVQLEENIVADKYREGAVKTILVNAFERDRKARAECIKAYGYKCQICGFDFGEVYGEEFEKLIHVHHIKPLKEIREDYIVDPKKDLIPVCPNCHMVMHSREEGYTPQDIKSILNRVNKREL